MSGMAHVGSLAAVEEFRVALCRFIDAARQALMMAHMEQGRFLDWIGNDLPRYWKAQIQRRSDEVAEARTNLTRVKMRTMGGRPPSCMEERIALRQAQAKLQEAEEKLALVRRWALEARQAVEESQGPLHQLSAAVEGDLPEALGLIDAALAALDAYVAISAPTAIREMTTVARSTPDDSREADAPNASREAATDAR